MKTILIAALLLIPQTAWTQITPSFGGATVGNLIYAAGTAIRPLRLPGAIGGGSSLSYALTGALPSGLALDIATHILFGTPASVAAQSTYTWTATNRGGGTDSLVFTIEIQNTSVCGRTPTVRNAIVEAIDGVTACENVTATQLSGVTSLNTRQQTVATGTTLRVGDFDGLTSLTSLDMTRIGLTGTLPAGLFDELVNLEELNLWFNRLTTLPGDIFRQLTSLRHLQLRQNFIRTLPDGLFQGLGPLQTLYLAQRDDAPLVFEMNVWLVQDPAGWRAMVREAIPLNAQVTVTLSDGMTTTVTMNAGTRQSDPFTDTGTPRITGAQFQLPAGRIGPTDATSSANRHYNGFRLVARPTPPGVTLAPTAFTIPEGEAATYTVVLDAAPTANVAVTPAVTSAGNVVTLSSAPVFTMTNWNSPQTVTVTVPDNGDAGDAVVTITHTASGSGLYGAITAGQVVVTVLDDDADITSVCGRTPQVRDGIVAAIDGVTACQYVTATQLGRIPAMQLTRAGINTLRVGDFDGLVALTSLDMGENRLTTLPSGLFDGLDALEVLFMGANRFDRLPGDIFNGLSNLRELSLAGNRIRTLPSRLFQELGPFDVLYLSQNSPGTSVFDLNVYLVPFGTGWTVAVREAAPLIIDVDVMFSSGELATVRMNAGDRETTGFTGSGDPRITDVQFQFPAGRTGPTDATAIFGGDGTVRSYTGFRLVTRPTPPRVMIDPQVHFIPEGETATYTVVLSAAPTTDVTVTPAVTPSDNVVTLSSGLSSLVFTTANWNSAQTVTITAADDDDEGNLQRFITYTARGSGYGAIEGGQVVVVVNDNDVGICDRTQQVRDVIVAAISGVTGCETVTAAQLSEITSLNVQGRTVATGTTLRVGDFDGLTSLTSLNLTSMGLTGTLPAGLFNELQNLEELNLWFNQLTTLPGDIFRQLTSLEHLQLRQNFIRTLPDGLFQGLGPLQTLYLAQRPPGPLVFEMNVSLVQDAAGWRAVVREAVPLNAQVTVTLSDGMTTTITMNAGTRQSAPFTDTGTPRITGAQFQLPAGRVGPTDATSSANRHYNGFRLVVQTTPPGATLDPTALNIPEGEAATYTVVLDAAPTANVTVTPTVTPAGNVVTLSSAPVFTTTNWNSPQTVTVTATDNSDTGDAVVTITHTTSGSGYGALTAGQVVVIVLDDDAGITSVCGRTPEVRDAIVAAIEGVSACQDVTATQVRAITVLQMNNDGINTLRVGDFDGLVALTSMDLGENNLNALPSGLFSGLGALRVLFMGSNPFPSLPGDIFSGLSNLRQLSLGGGALRTLPDGLFEGLGPFEVLYLTQSLQGPAVFDLTVSLVQGSDGWRAAIREAAPLNIQVTVRRSGGTTTTVTMNAGTRQTAPFTDTGTPRITDVQFQFPAGRTGPTDATAIFVGDGTVRSYTGFRLVTPPVPPESMLAPPSITVTEGETATYTVVLAAAPTADVTVTPTVTAGNIVTLSSAPVFTATNWNSPQTVTVTATDNGDADDEVILTITHTASGSGYSAITAGQVVVTVLDDDAPSFDATIAPQFYGVDSTIPPLTLPAASRGDAPLTYALTGVLPDGLTFDLATRRLSGTPTALASAVTYTWTVTDSDGDIDDRVFTIAVVVTDVCTRSPGVRDAIVRAIPAVNDCQHVTPTHLSRITSLGSDRAFSRQTLRSGDFAGLSGLETLILSVNLFNTLPEDILNGLSALRVLDLGDNDFRTLPANLFAGLIALEELRLSGNIFLASVPAGIFSGLGALRDLGMVNLSALGSLPAGLFSGLDALEELRVSGGLNTVPAGLFSGLDAFNRLEFGSTGIEQLPEGMFDGVSGTFLRLDLSGNPSVPFTLSIDLEQRGDGRGRVRVREAAPLAIEVDWMVSAGDTGTIIIPQGRRTSAEFGTSMNSAATITLSNPRFRGVTEDTTEDYSSGNYSGLRLAIASSPRPGVVFHPARLTVSENSTAPYTVVLNTAPTGTVTITPNVTPSDSDVSLSPGALIFTATNWHQAQSVTVTAAADTDNTDDTATITYTVSGYNGVTAATLAVTVADDDDQRPEFDVTIAPQTYTAGAVIPTLTLPEAMGGDGDLVYRLNRRALPAGLRYTPRTRTLSGIPTTAGPAVTLTWTVMDTDSNQLPEDASSLTFTVAVIGAVAGVTIVPTDITVNEGRETTYTVVLAAASEGTVTIMLSLNGPVTHRPAALTFGTANWNTAQRVTITAPTDPDSDDASATITHTVSGYGAITTAAPVTVTIHDTRGFPSFDGAMVDNMVYGAGMAIPPLRLPDAIAGDGMLVYALTGDILPGGLTFDLATRLLSGTPDAVTSEGTYTWTATDRDADTARLVFTIHVQMTNVCGRSQGVRDALVAAIPGVTDCQHVTPTHLSRITRLIFYDDASFLGTLRNMPPRNGDFDGLSGLEILNLATSFFTALPENVFNGLSALRVLDLGENDFRTLPENLFTGLSSLEELRLSGNVELRSLPAGLFSGLGSLRDLGMVNLSGYTSPLPAGLFSGLDALEQLRVSGGFSTLPAGMFSGLGVLNHLELGSGGISAGGISQLPEGIFDGVSGPLGERLDLDTNPGAPFTLSIDLEQRGDGRGRARVREAAPLDIEVDWMISGGGTGTIVIPQGRRTSDEFGMAMTSAATITLSNPRFRGVTEPTDDSVGTYLGFQLAIASTPHPGVVFHPARLTVHESDSATYTVVLNTAPAGNVTLTPTIAPSGHDLSLSTNALTFTAANWHQAQSVTVTAAADADDTDDTPTITWAVSGYSGVTEAALAVTVADDDDHRPEFIAVDVPPQTYTAGAVIPTLTLPEAISGDGDLVYRLNRPALPAGLRYTPRTRTLSGLPTTVGPAVTLTWTVMDTDSNQLPDDTDALIFTVTVIESVAGVTITPTDITMNEGAETTYDVVLAAAPEGSVTITLTLNGPVTHTPAALTFETTDWNISQRVTITASTDPDAADAMATITHTVSGYGAITTAAPVTITVHDIRAFPSFGGATVGDLVYATGTAIRPLRLPGAIGGDGRLSYALAGTLPSGLTFDIATHLLSGMPDGVASQSTHTWTATDRDADTASLVFTIEIQNTSVCGRTPTVRNAIVAAIDGVMACENVTATQLSGVTSLNTRQQRVAAGTTLRVGDFDGLTSLTSLDMTRIGLTGTLPAGLFDELVNLEELNLWFNRLTTLPGDIFRQLTSLEHLDLRQNFIRTLPDGLFQGLGPLQTLYLAQRGDAPLVFEMNVWLVQDPAGWRAMVREAIPLNAQVTVTLSDGMTTTVTMNAGTRQSDPFTDTGTPRITGAQFQLPAGRIGPTDATSSAGRHYNGFRLVIQPTPPGVTLAPTALTIPEGEAATYTVVLDAAPTAAVSVTSTVAPAGNVVTLSSAPVFTATNWSRPQTVTVTVPDNGDAGDAVVTITHTARGSGYGAITAGQVVVTVLDDDANIPPSFDEITVAPQIYGRNSAIPPLMLPAASRGNDPITYDLTGALPPGLAVDRVQRTLSGTPTALAPASTYTWTATDHDGDTASVTFTIEVQMTSVCGRTPQVRDAIVGAIRAVNDCRHVTPTHLSRITGLNFERRLRNTPPRSGDFAGLSGLENLNLEFNNFTSLPENLFAGLSALEVLRLGGNNFPSLPENLFAGLSALERLFITDTFLRSLPAGIFSRLGALRELYLQNSDLASLPVGIFSGLDKLEVLHLRATRLATLPAGIFSGLDALQELDLAVNQFSQLTEGMFDGVSGPLGRRLYLYGNLVDPFSLSVDLEQRGDGRGQARVREAAPLDIEVDWMVSGMAGSSGTALIPQGRRTSDEFGMPMDSPATITLSNPRFRGVTEATDDFQDGAYSGFRLVVASSPRPGVVFSPVRVTMFENTARTYTVLLNTAPTGDVTLTASVTPSDADITISPGTLIITAANWHRAQSVTVAAVADADTTDDTVTITYAVSGYGDVTTAALPVVVTDPQSAPSFPVAAVADQTYSVRVSIPTLTLPEATAGDGGRRYTLTGPIPAGLSFDASARTLAGIPTAAAAAVTLTYTVTDADADRSAGDRATLTMTVTVISDVPGVTVDPTDLPVDEGAMATYMVWLATAPTGTVTVTPVDTGGVTTSGAVTFSPADWRMARTVTVTALVDRDNTDDTVTLTHTVSGYGDVTAGPTVTVTIRDISSALAFVEPAVADQAYNRNEAIPTLTLPAATGGEGDPTYALRGDIPDGLEIDLDTRTLTGTPTGVVSVTLTWTATERDDTAALTFTVTVTGLVAIETGTLTLNEGTMTTYTVVLNRAPAGDVTVTPVSGNAVVLTVSDPLIFSPTTWNTRQSVTVTTFGDPDTDADTVTITHMVTGFGDAEAPAVIVTVTDTGVVFPITLAPSSLTVDEGDTVTYTVVMRRVPPGDVTVTPTVATGTVTVSPRDLTFTPTTWNVAQTVAVVAADVTADVTVTITHSLTGFGDITEGGELAVAVRDSAPTFGETMVASQTYVVNSAITPLILPEAARGDGSLSYVLVGTIPGLTWTGADRRLTGTPTTVGDPVALTYIAMDEADQEGSLTFTVTITPAPDVRLSTDALPVPEGGMATYTVRLTTVPNGDVTVTLAVAPPAGDVTVSGALTFTSVTWNTAQTVTVNAAEDGDSTNDTATIRHTVTGYGSVTSAADVVVTVTDNDAADTVPAFVTAAVPDQTYTTGETITLTLPAATGGNGQPAYTLNGAIPAGLTYADRTLSGMPTTAAPAVTLTWTVADTDGNTATSDEASLTFTVTVTPPPGVTLNPTALAVPEGAMATYTVRLTTVPAGAVTVTPAVTSPAGDVTVSGALTFTSVTWNTAQTVTVDAAEDGDSTDDTATIGHTVTGYGSVTSAADVVVTVTDNDAADMAPAFVTAMVPDQTYTAGEAITLTLPAATGGNGQPAYTLHGVIPTGLTYAARTLSGTPTTMAAAVTLTWTVSDADDNTAPGDEASLTFTVTVTRAPGVTLNPTALTVTENAITTYTVVLTTEPAGSVTVAPAVGAGSAVTVTGALTFSPTSWSTVQTITVTALDDADATDDTATITHTVTGYGRVTAGEVTVTVTDDDMPGVTLDTTALTVWEGAMATYTIVLATLPAGDVTVIPSVASPAGEVTVSGALTITAATWNIAQTVTVTAAEDADSIDDTATITHTVTGYGSLTEGGAVTVTVTDTDIDIAPGFVVDGVDNQVYIVDMAIPPLTLPEATGGNEGLAYTLTGDLPVGLTFTAGALTLTGTPTTVAPAVTLTWTVADTDANTAATDTATLTFAVTVRPSVVTFGAAMVAVQTYISGTAISAVTLPAATSGIVPLTYALRGPLPAGLTVDVATRTLSGTPTDAVPSSVYTWTVTDSAGDMASLEFTITVHATSTCSRSPEVRDAIEAAAGDVDCGAVTTSQLGGIQTLDLSSMSLDPLRSGDLAGLSALEILMLNDNGLTTLPEGIFDGLVSLNVLHLDDNDGSPFTLSIDLEQLANGQFRARIRQAAPLAVEVTWTDIGMAAGGGATGAIASVEGVGDYTGTARIPAGQRTSEPFGMRTSTIALSGHLFSGVTEPTSDDMGSYRGFQLELNAAAIRAGVGITPRALSVPEGTSDIYTVWLTTEPAGDVTVVPSVSPADGGVTVSAALTFTTANWSDLQTVTVTSGDEADGGEFTVSHAVRGYGNVVAVDVVVTVGPSEAEIVARLTDLNRVILPEVARVLSDQGISAVSRRIQQAQADSTGGGGERSLTVGGQSTFAGLATTHGRALAEGNLDLKTLLGGSSFVLPLNASGVGPMSMLSGVTLWGGGDYRSLSGKADAFDWSGDVLSARVGADMRLGSDLLAGVAVSWNQVDLGYTTGGDRVLGGGDYDVDLTSVNPYVGWTALGGRLDLWATAGYGWGELEVKDNQERVGQRASDVTLKTVGAGGSGQILQRGATTLRLKGEALHTSMDVEGGGRMASLMVEARRARLGLELAHTHVLAGGGQFVPRFEVGMRHDAGDGRTGTGAEVGGGVRYTDAAWGLTVESHGRILVGHTGDYEDWGLGGSVRFEAGRGGRGLSLSVRPTWGPTASRVDQVWSQSAAVTVPASGGAPVQRSGQMDIDIGYGLGWGEEVLLVPYGRLTVTSSPARTWRVGSRMSVGPGVTFNVEGVREETAARLVNQGLRLNLGLGLSNGVRLNVEGMRQQNAAEALNQGIQLQLGLDF